MRRTPRIKHCNFALVEETKIVGDQSKPRQVVSTSVMVQEKTKEGADTSAQGALTNVWPRKHWMFRVYVWNFSLYGENMLLPAALPKIFEEFSR